MSLNAIIYHNRLRLVPAQAAEYTSSIRYSSALKSEK